MRHGKERTAILRFAARTRREVRRSESGPTGAGVSAEGGTSVEHRIVAILAGGGPALPPPLRAARHREEIVARAETLTLAGTTEDGPATAVVARRRPMTLLARIAAVSAVVVALLVGTGYASTSAMPGNSLYGVKRWIEGARLAFTPGGQTKASAYLSYADRRVDELEYAEKKGMREWYYSLSRDAQARLRNTDEEASRLEPAGKEAILADAKRTAARLESSFNRVIPALNSSQRESLEEGLKTIKRRLGMREGGPAPGTQGEPSGPDQSGPEQRNGEPQDGLQQGNHPETQPGQPSDSQQQGTQTGPGDQQQGTT